MKMCNKIRRKIRRLNEFFLRSNIIDKFKTIFLLFRNFKNRRFNGFVKFSTI